VELDIRNIKTTLGLEVLQCLTPQMVEKELWANGPAASNLELESDDLSRFPGSRCLEVWRAARYALMVTCYALK
jgi:hypothetical protein